MEEPQVEGAKSSDMSSARRGRRISRGRAQGRYSGSRGRSNRRSRGRGIDESVRGEAETAEQRKQRLHAMVNNLPEQRLRELAVQMVDAYPSIMHNLLEPVGRQPGSGYHPPSGSACPSWCICGHCREMPSQEERVCCGMNPVCISTVPEMDHITHPFNLRLARAQRGDILVFEEDQDEATANRHAAYRQFVFWQHGRLGAGNRTIIPACCVWRIRDVYPDPFGQYTGYKPSRLI